jgi:dipeptidase E
MTIEQPTMAKRILLISNSTLYGSGYLDHAEAEIRDFLSGVSDVVFIPYALHDQDAYATKASERFSRMGYTLTSVHQVGDPIKAVETAGAVFIGGGNTFRLLKAIYDFGLLEPIQRRVQEGMPYIGTSAGSNVAGLTIKTTNDMPIVQPTSFNALGLVKFQINPHFIDADPQSTHMGETREERLLQFHEENDTPVIGMREGAMVRVEENEMTLKGSFGARVFRKNMAPIEVQTGSSLNELLAI